MSHVSLITNVALLGFINGLKSNDCDVKHDKEAGTVEAFDDELPVLKAIQKGKGGPWIVRFIDGGRIKWGPPK